MKLPGFNSYGVIIVSGPLIALIFISKWTGWGRLEHAVM